MEFLHKVKMQVLEASLIVRTPTLKVRVLDDKDHFDHERVKDGFSLLDVHNSTHDGTKVCAHLHNIAHRVDAADALDDCLALCAMGVGHKHIFFVSYIGISLNGPRDQVAIILRSKMEQVDVGRLVIITAKICVLETRIQDAGDEVLAEMKHRHIRVEWVQQVYFVFGNLIEYRTAEVAELGGSHGLSCIKYVLERLGECRGASVSDCSLIPITLSNGEEKLEDVCLEFGSLLRLVLSFRTENHGLSLPVLDCKARICWDWCRILLISWDLPLELKRRLTHRKLLGKLLHR